MGISPVDASGDDALLIRESAVWLSIKTAPRATQKAKGKELDAAEKRDEMCGQWNIALRQVYRTSVPLVHQSDVLLPTILTFAGLLNAKFAAALRPLYRQV